MKKNDWPIIHFIGLPGAGKTTMAIALSRVLKLPILRIGAFRAKQPASAEGEADAWLGLYQALSQKKWRNCILETTGMNRRECFLNSCFPLLGVVTIKLVAPRKVLLARVGRKPKNERGADWQFSHTFPDKKAFVEKSFAHFKKLPGLIEIDTSRAGIRATLKRLLLQLKFYDGYVR